MTQAISDVQPHITPPPKYGDRQVMAKMFKSGKSTCKPTNVTEKSGMLMTNLRSTRYFNSPCAECYATNRPPATEIPIETIHSSQPPRGFLHERLSVACPQALR
jgi:hypothetical protein